MTEAEYNKLFTFLKKADPDNALIAVLDKGYSPINALYLKNALSKLSVLATDEFQKSEDAADTEYHVKKRQLYGERAKLSNKFHLCQTDAQRAEVSLAIREVQRDIESVNEDLRYFEEHGKARPAPESATDYPVPTDGIKLAKKQSSIRASISRYKKQVKELKALRSGDPRKKDIAGIEDKLKHKQTHLKHVEAAIKEKSI